MPSGVGKFRRPQAVRRLIFELTGVQKLRNDSNSPGHCFVSNSIVFTTEIVGCTKHAFLNRRNELRYLSIQIDAGNLNWDGAGG